MTKVAGSNSGKSCQRKTDKQKQWCIVTCHRLLRDCLSALSLIYANLSSSLNSVQRHSPMAGQSWHNLCPKFCCRCQPGARGTLGLAPSASGISSLRRNGQNMRAVQPREILTGSDDYQNISKTVMGQWKCNGIAGNDLKVHVILERSWKPRAKLWWLRENLGPLAFAPLQTQHQLRSRLQPQHQSVNHSYIPQSAPAPSSASWGAVGHSWGTKGARRLVISRALWF